MRHLGQERHVPPDTSGPASPQLAHMPGSPPLARTISNAEIACWIPSYESSSSTFYDEEGRFVPRCACGAYGTFGVGVSLRHGKEGTWSCGPCWRALAEWTRI